MVSVRSDLAVLVQFVWVAHQGDHGLPADVVDVLDRHPPPDEVERRKEYEKADDQ